MNEWLYENNDDNSSRYLLGTKGEKTLFVFGINPSSAEPNNPDSTIMKVQKIANNNGYDSWIMLNVYPKRETIFEKLNDLQNNDEHIKNLQIIINEVAKHKQVDVWAAFGDHLFDRDYLVTFWKDIYTHLSDFKINWLSGMVNKSGTPRHPLYQKDDIELSVFDMDTFVKGL